MEIDLEKLFSKDKTIIEKLQRNATILNYKILFFEHLGPELKKIFKQKKDKVMLKHFYEGAQYEFGFFDKKIDLRKAFTIYKKYADSNDYFCMYKMHIIYLCENEKFKVHLNRILEKLYLIKCLAYLPNYYFEYDKKLFEKIDIKNEVIQMIHLEDENLKKHQKFFDILNSERNKYNLNENDIILMQSVLFCLLHKDENASLTLLSLKNLNSIKPKFDKDYSYYHAKIKCIYFQKCLNVGKIISDNEIENYYKEIKEKKLYEFYNDYGNYLLNKKLKVNQEIISIFKVAANNGFIFNSLKVYQCLINQYFFDDIMKNNDTAFILLDYILDEIVFEKICLKEFIMLLGFLIKYDKSYEIIFSKYFDYIKEINEYVDSYLIKKVVKKKKEENHFIIKAYIYYFGFENNEKKSLQKAVEYLDKAININTDINILKSVKFIQYNIKSLMNILNLYQNKVLQKEKKDLCKLFSTKYNLSNKVIDCFILGQDYFEGITKNKDKLFGSYIYDYAQNLFSQSILDCLYKNKILKFLAEQKYNTKIENSVKDEICGICYLNKVNQAVIPCKHYFCSECIKLLVNDPRCPICRRDFFNPLTETFI